MAEKVKRIVLSKDPEEALQQIAEFIDTKMIRKGRMYPDNADKREFLGYWQDIKFHLNLQAISHQIKEM